MKDMASQASRRAEIGIRHSNWYGEPLNELSAQDDRNYTTSTRSFTN